MYVHIKCPTLSAGSRIRRVCYVYEGYVGSAEVLYIWGVEMCKVVGVGLYWKLIGTIMGFEGYHYCMPLETLLALKYNSFILTVSWTVGIIGVDSHARDMYGNGHSQGTYVLWEIPHPCIN